MGKRGYSGSVNGRLLLFLLIICLGVPNCNFLRAETLVNSMNADNPKGFLVESLIPMFFFGGYHIAVGYRFEYFRIRASVIYSGNYDAEPAGINNTADKFSRFYDNGSSGIFLGWFPFTGQKWISGIHIYGFLEYHIWKIQEKSTGIIKRMDTLDAGPGLGYQLFIWKGLYLQPAIHYYMRVSKTLSFPGSEYSIPTADVAFVFRVGWQF